MKNSAKTLLAVLIFAFAACGGDTPKTDLNQQEQAAVDSTLANDEVAMDSLENAIKAQIGEDSTVAESHEGHNH